MQLAALLRKRLMHMSPKQRAYLLEAVNQGKQSIGIAQSNWREPVAADIDGMMMQGYQAVPCARFA